MVNIFDSFEYALQYEQLSLDTDQSYKRFAETSVSLVEATGVSKVLDLGCGTGISTCVLFDKFEDIKVVGLDRASLFLKMASYKFGKLEDTEEVFETIKKKDYYPGILRKEGDIKDLEEHLRVIFRDYKKFKDNVVFYCKDASELYSIDEGEFDYVLANQFIHWLRKEGIKLGDRPNLDYERIVLQQVRNKLKLGGRFGFNTSGADFRFDDQNLNDIHVLEHPFYIAFNKSLHSQLDLDFISTRNYTFDHDEIARIMDENGFKILGNESVVINRNPKSLIEVCLIGGHMQIFQKANISLNIEERTKILKDALSYALRVSSPGIKPYIETGAHYLVRKV